MRKQICTLVLLSAAFQLAQSYYVPGTYPTEFTVGEQLQGKQAQISMQCPFVMLCTEVL